MSFDVGLIGMLGGKMRGSGSSKLGAIFSGCVGPSSRAAGIVVTNNVCFGPALFGLFLFLSVGGWEGKRVGIWVVNWFAIVVN